MKRRFRHDTIIVKKTPEREVSPNGIIIPESARKDPNYGEVIAVSPCIEERMTPDGKIVFRPMDVKVGDFVAYYANPNRPEVIYEGQKCVSIRQAEVIYTDYKE